MIFNLPPEDILIARYDQPKLLRQYKKALLKYRDFSSNPEDIKSLKNLIDTMKLFLHNFGYSEEELKCPQ